MKKSDIKKAIKSCQEQIEDYKDLIQFAINGGEVKSMSDKIISLKQQITDLEKQL